MSSPVVVLEPLPRLPPSPPPPDPDAERGYEMPQLQPSQATGERDNTRPALHRSERAPSTKGSMNSFTSTEGAGVAGPDISRVTSGFPRRSKFSTEYVISSATGELEGAADCRVGSNCMLQ